MIRWMTCPATCLMLCLSAAAAEPPFPGLNVRDFGAVGDAKTDDTAAFQRALDAAADAGGPVFVPTGHYLIATHLNVPPDVSLTGVWQKPPAPTAGQLPPTDPLELKGSVLLAVEGAGDPDGTPFITLGRNAALQGMTVFYPEQQATETPTPYPWTIRNAGDDASVIDVLLVNPYQAVDFGSVASGRHYIRNLFAQAIYRGIFVDQCYDIGRIENVHLWPFWEQWHTPLRDFTLKEGKAFIIGRTDWEHITNCFCIGYDVGFEFVSSQAPVTPHNPGGPGNALITGGGADMCNTAVHAIATQQHSGMSFANSQIFGDIVVAPSHTGLLKFTGCGLFGSIHGDNDVVYGKLDGTGRTSFSNCHFWPLDARAAHASKWFDVYNGRLSLVGCSFEGVHSRPIVLHEGVRAAIIVANELGGTLRVENASRGKVEIASNADGVGWLDAGWIPLETVQPGTEVTDLVPNGDFSDQSVWEADGPIRFGDGDARAYPGDTEAGSALLTQELTLEPDTEYVLSAYMWNFGSSERSVAANVDLDDAVGEANLELAHAEPESRTGCFVYKAFHTARTGTDVVLRVFYDRPIGEWPEGEVAARWANIAITPASRFRPPETKE